MTFRYSLVLVGALALTSTVVIDGCKSSNQQVSSASQGNTAQQINGTVQTGSAPQASNPQAPAYSNPSAPANPGPPPPSAPSGANPAPGQAPSSAPAAQMPPPPQAPPPPQMVDLPTGTNLRVRLDEDLGSKISRPGDSFSATVADDVVVDGQTVIAKGSRADGTVIDAKPLGRIKGGAVLQLRLERVHTNWGSYPVATSTISRVEQGKGKRTGIFAAGGGALGAIIGGIAGGGKGALIGGLVGAGAGGAGSAFTGNKEILIPAETLLTFQLDHSVHITEQPQ